MRNTNFQLNSKNALVSIDWLSVGGKGILPDNERFAVVRQEKGTNIFAFWGKIYYNERYFGDLLQNPHSKILHPQTFNIRVANEWFYNSNFLTILRDFLGESLYNDAHLIRLDVAVDSDQHIFGFSREIYMDALASNRWLLLGRAKQSVYFGHGDSLVVDTVTIGKRSGGVTMTWYDKSKELKEVKPKPYISDVWVMAGFDVDRVNRIEASFNFNAILALHAETGLLARPTLADIEDSKYCLSLWASAIERRFDVRVFSSDSNKSRWPRIELQLSNFVTTSQIYNYQQAASVDRSAFRAITSMLKVIGSDDHLPTGSVTLRFASLMDAIATLATRNQIAPLVHRYIKNSAVAEVVFSYINSKIIEL